MQSKPPRPGSRTLADHEPPSLALQDDQDPQFADTVRQPLMPLEEPVSAFGGLSIAPMEISLYEVMAEIGKENRVCPQPTRWLEFYRTLQDFAPGRPLPSPPITGSAWASTPSLRKRMCFRGQVEWAASNGCLQAAYDFIRALPDSDWHYAD
jgi:hypothetical protein